MWITGVCVTCGLQVYVLHVDYRCMCYMWITGVCITGVGGFFTWRCAGLPATVSSTVCMCYKCTKICALDMSNGGAPMACVPVENLFVSINISIVRTKKLA